MSLQAKNIPTAAVVEAIRTLRVTPYSTGDEPPDGGRWVDRWELARHLGFPEKVVLAKLRKLVRQKVIRGCACGCRGDFLLPPEPEKGTPDGQDQN